MGSLCKELEREFEGQLKELSSFKLELTEDPVADGLLSLHAEMVAARKANDRAAQLLAMAIWKKAAWQKKFNGLKSVVGMKRADFIANDEEVKAGKDVKTREALAEIKLKYTQEYKDFQEASECYDLVSAAVSSIETFWRVFRDYRDDLNFQLNVVAQRVALGEVDLPGFEVEYSGYPKVKEMKVDNKLFEDQEGIGYGIGEIDL